MWLRLGQSNPEVSLIGFHTSSNGMPQDTLESKSSFSVIHYSAIGQKRCRLPNKESEFANMESLGRAAQNLSFDKN